MVCPWYWSERSSWQTATCVAGGNPTEHREMATAHVERRGWGCWLWCGISCTSHSFLKSSRMLNTSGTRRENESFSEWSVFLRGCGEFTLWDRPAWTGNPEVWPHGSRGGWGHGVRRCGQPPGDCPGLHRGLLRAFLSHNCWPWPQAWEAGGFFREEVEAQLLPGDNGHLVSSHVSFQREFSQ